MKDTIIRRLSENCTLIKREFEVTDAMDSVGDWAINLLAPGAQVMYAADVARSWVTFLSCNRVISTRLGNENWGVIGNGQNLTGDEQLTFDGLPLFLVRFRRFASDGFEEIIPARLRYFPVIMSLYQSGSIQYSKLSEHIETGVWNLIQDRGNVPRTAAFMYIQADDPQIWARRWEGIKTVANTLMSFASKDFQGTSKSLLSFVGQMFSGMQAAVNRARSAEEYYAAATTEIDKMFEYGDPKALYVSGFYVEAPRFNQQLETYYKVQVHGQHQPMLRQFCSAFPGSCDVLKYGTNNTQSMLMLKQNVTYEQAYAETDQVARNCQSNPTDPACVQWNFTSASSVDAIAKVQSAARLDLAKKIGVGVGAAALVLILMNVLRKD